MSNHNTWTGFNDESIEEIAKQMTDDYFSHIPKPKPSTKEEIVKRLVDAGLLKLPDISLTILGEPKAQKRHRHVKMGNFVRNYDPSSADKGDFLSIIQSNAPEKPFDQPLRVDVNFYFSRPKSHFKAGKSSHILKDNAPEWHTSKPDRDNLDKFVMDSMSKVYWRDDSVVCCGEIKKKYSDTPRTEIYISKL